MSEEDANSLARAAEMRELAHKRLQVVIKKVGSFVAVAGSSHGTAEEACNDANKRLDTAQHPNAQNAMSVSSQLPDQIGRARDSAKNALDILPPASASSGQFYDPMGALDSALHDTSESADRAAYIGDCLNEYTNHLRTITSSGS
jgi:hypothetical protein